MTSVFEQHPESSETRRNKSISRSSIQSIELASPVSAKSRQSRRSIQSTQLGSPVSAKARQSKSSIQPTQLGSPVSAKSRQSKGSRLSKTKKNSGETQLLKNLTADEFKHILSIGFEMEAHHLTKLVKNNRSEMYYTSNTTVRTQTHDNTTVVQRGDETFRKYHNREEFMCRSITNPDEEDPNAELYTEEFCALSDMPSEKLRPYKTFCDSKKNQTVEKYYIFRPDGKPFQKSDVLPINRFEDNMVACDSFPDVEWQNTFYRPNQSPKVILVYLKQALQNVIGYIVTLKNKSATEVAVYNGFKQQYNRISKAVEITGRYFILKTMLFGDTLLAQSSNKLNWFKIVPQVTFSCQTSNLLKILPKLVFPSMTGKKQIEAILAHIKQLTDPVVTESMKAYLFILWYIVKCYQLFKLLTKKKEYFKYVLAFMPRHGLPDIIKELDKPETKAILHFLKTYFKGKKSTVQVLIDILHHYPSLNKTNVMNDLTERRVSKSISESEYESLMTVVYIVEEMRISSKYSIKNDVVFIEFRQLAHMIKHYLGNPKLEVDLFRLKKLIK